MKTALAYVVQPPPGSTKPDTFHLLPISGDEDANEGTAYVAGNDSPEGYCEEGDTFLVRYDPQDQFATILDSAKVEGLISAARLALHDLDEGNTARLATRADELRNALAALLKG